MWISDHVHDGARPVHQQIVLEVFQQAAKRNNPSIVVLDPNSPIYVHIYTHIQKKCKANLKIKTIHHVGLDAL